MALVDCGVAFQVPQPAKRRWLVAALACAAITLFATTTNLYVLPLGVWACLFARLEEKQVAPVLVALDRIAFVGVRSIMYVHVRSVKSRGNRIVVRAAGYALAFDASLLDPIARALVVRHIEARALFARSGRKCSRAERTALEALHVFGASAVRVHKRKAIEILDGEGPWSARRGNVYVRSSGAPTSPYRSNARTGAIEVGSLENEFAVMVS
jgi:hypothetical protein